MEFDQFNDENIEKPVDVKNIIEKYLPHLKWFLISGIIFGTLAFFKVRYEVPKYNIKASILIKEEERGKSIGNISNFDGLGLFGMGDGELKNEMEVIKSRKLMTNVVKELNLNIKYYIEDSPYDIEFYPNFPIVLNMRDSIDIIRFSSQFEIVVLSNDKFEFIDFNEATEGIKHFDTDFRANIGNKNISDNRLLNIKLNDSFKNDLIGKRIKVIIRPISSTVNEYLEKLSIEPIDELKSKVINLSINESVKEKGVFIINNLIQQYNADGINDKNLISINTTDFLNERIELIAKELTAIESTAAQFKTNRGIVDPNGGAANIYLQSSSVAERELVGANTQLQLIEFMIEELNERGKGESLPGNIGLSDMSIVNMISEYNTLVLQRNRILKSSSEINPIIRGIDSEMEVLRSNLISSLDNLKKSSQIQIYSLNENRLRIGSKIASVPKHEKEYKEIVRGQETKNALFLFLLQKREESILSSAVSIEKAKVIDNAFASTNPISPKKKVIYLIFIIIGLMIPAVIIYLKELLDTKVHDVTDLKKLNMPYLGDVPEVKNKELSYIKTGDNSKLAEAFRYIRTNIGFMLDRKEHGKIIFVTSTIQGEGKTFTAINLASSLAFSGKKTLLLGMDLRAPKVSKYLKIEDKLGVTNFVMNKRLSVEDLTASYDKISNLDIINSGDIPPNPVELLMSKRINELFENIKNKYEYIIVDTAPVGMVTDTIQINKYADLTIYVVKANVLDKRMLHIPVRLHKENKLSNMSILINGTDLEKGNYGYGYGYGNTVKKPWYKLFN